MGSSPRSLVFVSLLLAGLIGLGELQRRWIEDLAVAQLEQERRLLVRAAEELAAELGRLFAPIDDELARADRAAEALPDLARAVLGDGALEDYALAVVAREHGDALYRSPSAEELPPDARPDAEVEVFAGTGGWVGRFQGGAQDPAAEVLVPVQGTAPWRLAVYRRAGSLEELVARSRRRNYALGAGLLLLLGAGAGWSLLAERRARELARAERAFVAGVSHELRTPLAVIRTASSNLVAGIVEPARVGEYAGLIAREVERLQAMIEKVLGLAAGRAAQARERTTFAAEAWLETSMRSACMRAAAQAGDVQSEVAPGLGELRADRAQLASVLANLIENALLHGAAPVTVRARRDGGDLVLEVEDRGPGLEADERPRLFEPFFRGRAARRAARPGSGLGLALAAEVAAEHGGSLESVEVEHGACFRLSIPCAPAEERV